MKTTSSALDAASVVILPDDDEAAVATKKNNLIQALAALHPEDPKDALTGLRRAYEIARASGANEEEERLIRAINRTVEMRRLQRKSCE